MDVKYASPVKETQGGSSKILDIDRITIVEGRRRLKSNEEFLALKENILEIGLIDPPTVRPIGDGRFELLAGHHRLKALEELGKTAVRVTVLELPDDHIEWAAFSSNLHVSTLSELEKYRYCKQRHHSAGLTQDQIGREINRSRAYVGVLLRSFADIDTSLLKLFEQRPSTFGAETADLVGQASKSNAAATESLVSFHVQNPSHTPAKLKKELKDLLKGGEASKSHMLRHSVRRSGEIRASLSCKDGKFIYEYLGASGEEDLRRFEAFVAFIEDLEDGASD
jgi:ParB/RepB/Spo0J family partition protein